MKAIPPWQPPPAPAGITRCGPDVLERWRSDSFRFPPYQYKRENLVVDNDSNLRYLNSSERELLLGFGKDHTLFAWNAGDAKADPVGYEDKRLSLCGDSFSMLSFGWVISQLCREWETTPQTPQEILDRFGLPPGAGLACPLCRLRARGQAQCYLEPLSSWWLIYPGMLTIPGPMFPSRWGPLSTTRVQTMPALGPHGGSGKFFSRLGGGLSITSTTWR